LLNAERRIGGILRYASQHMQPSSKPRSPVLVGMKALGSFDRMSCSSIWPAQSVLVIMIEVWNDRTDPQRITTIIHTLNLSTSMQFCALRVVMPSMPQCVPDTGPTDKGLKAEQYSLFPKTW
jgi:hypothetical protein